MTIIPGKVRPLSCRPAKGHPQVLIIARREHKHLQRFIVAAAAGICAGLATPCEAHAQTPLEAFCHDNAAYLQTTEHESGLDPDKWASDPKNLARFGFSGPGDIDALYQMVIDKGAPYIESHWSNENGGIEWRCMGQ